MNSTPAQIQQRTSVNNSRITAPKYRAKVSGLIPFCFSLVIVLFSFTFFDLKVVGNAVRSDCHETAGKLKSISGFSLICGTTLPLYGADNDVAAGITGLENVQTPIEITFNLWALLAQAAAIGGLVLSVTLNKESDRYFYCLVSGAFGVVTLLFLASSVAKYEVTIDNGLNNVETQMVFQLPYWLALLSFTTAGWISFLRLILTRTTDTGISSPAPTPLCVRIILHDEGCSGRE